LIVKDEIAEDVKSLEYLSKIAGKPDRKTVLKPFKSKQIDKLKL